MLTWKKNVDHVVILIKHIFINSKKKTSHQNVNKLVTENIGNKDENSSISIIIE
jgi:hypothetical protein